MPDRSTNTARRKQPAGDRPFGQHERAVGAAPQSSTVAIGTTAPALPTYTGVVDQMNVRPEWITASAAPPQLIIRSVISSDSSVRERIWVIQAPFTDAVADLAVGDTMRFEAEVTPSPGDSDGSRWGFRRVQAIRRLDDEP